MELKKNPKLDYRRKYALFFNIGLVLSLALVISAFEMKFEELISDVDLMSYTSPDETVMVPITEHNPPPKPLKKQIAVIQIVEDDFDVDDIDIDFDRIEVDRIEDVHVEIEEMDVEQVEDIIVIAETMPSFVGGIEAFYTFVGKNLNYPAQARRTSIEGKVFVNFVVDKDGSLSDIRVVKGIGAGCEEEVERIIHKSPKWNPGKQRGVPVRVRMMMPITFRLD